MLPDFTSGLSQSSSRIAQFLKFLGRLWPVLLEQQRKRTIGEQLSPCLAIGTIIRFVVGVSDTLDFGTANRTRTAKFAVHSHFRPERGDVFREVFAGLLAQQRNPPA